MIILPQTVEMNWERRNKKYYIEKGYNYTSMHKTFLVNVEHLPPSSAKEVEVQCDYCKKIYKIKYSVYSKAKDENIIKKDCCSHCKGLKIRESNLLTYGVESVSQLTEVREKVRQTCIERYGVDNVSKVAEIKEKRAETNLNRYGVESLMQDDNFQKHCNEIVKQKYGVENIFQLEEIKEKIRETNLQKYGVESYTQTKEYIEKTKETNLKKYGIEYYNQTEECKKRVRETFLKNYGVTHPMKLKKYQDNAIKKGLVTKYKNRTMPISRQQIYINNLINGELNYPVGNCSLDIAFPEEMIYVEYDGGGHDLNVRFGDMTREQFKNKEVRRNFYLSGQGWERIRIISRKDRLPSDKQIIKLFNFGKEYLNSGHSWIEFDIDEKKVICSQYEESYDFGRLMSRDRFVKMFDKLYKNKEEVAV